MKTGSVARRMLAVTLLAAVGHPQLQAQVASVQVQFRLVERIYRANYRDEEVAALEAHTRTYMVEVLGRTFGFLKFQDTAGDYTLTFELDSELRTASRPTVVDEVGIRCRLAVPRAGGAPEVVGKHYFVFRDAAYCLDTLSRDSRVLEEEIQDCVKMHLDEASQAVVDSLFRRVPFAPKGAVEHRPPGGTFCMKPERQQLGVGERSVFEVDVWVPTSVGRNAGGDPKLVNRPCRASLIYLWPRPGSLGDSKPSPGYFLEADGPINDGDRDVFERFKKDTVPYHCGPAFLLTYRPPVAPAISPYSPTEFRGSMLP